MNLGITTNPVTFAGHELPSAVRHFQSASAEMLGAILDQSMDCIKLIGPGGQLDFMNLNGRCAMEIDEFALVAGRDWWDLWPEESQEAIRDAVARARRGESHRFEAFCPTAKGNPRWWEVSVSPLRDERGELQGIVSVSRDITDRVSAREVRNATADEMRHRLQNAYTLAGALVNAAAKGSPDREAFASEILQRLQRLGIAQSLLLEPGKFGTTDSAVLIRKLTEPFETPGCAFTFGELPAGELTEDQVRALALVIGELSTNSNKYGALGNGGTIRVDALREDAMLHIRWSERSTAERAGAPDIGQGNGFKLIHRALNACGGTFRSELGNGSLDATITLPLR